MVLDLNNFVQIAYVVDDLDDAMLRWLDVAKCGPFFALRRITIEDFEYRGVRGHAHDISVAMAQAGPVMIELIQQHNDEPSAYRDSFPEGSSGLHHLCSFTQDFDGELERLRLGGYPVAHRGRFGDIRLAYVDTREALGFMIEYVDDSAEIRAMYATVAAAAVDWDGTNPIRSF